MPGVAELLRRLGPGLVTGAADDDPSGIATYSQIGAQFGFALGWTMLFSFPLMAVIQEVSARIGCVTGRGLAQNLRRHYPPWLLRMVVLALVIANIINLGADIGAMAAAIGLLVGGPEHLYAICIGMTCVLLETFISYGRYASLLKWLTLSLFSYVAVVFVVGLSWQDALYGALVPSLSVGKETATAVVAVLGTTISPYLFFWQASQEVEELRRRHIKPLCLAPANAGMELRRIRFDTATGMAISNIVALFIIMSAAATLHANGITSISTSTQAAQALRPLAGDLAFALFAIGILSTGMLAVPVLAGSVAYAVTETFKWREGLDLKPFEATAFYVTIGFATLAGVGLTFAAIDPMKALYLSAVTNGILAAPLMACMMMIARNRRAMGRFTLGRTMSVLGWTATIIMTAATVMMVLL